MPITASLGALAYPRIYESAVLPSGLGYGTLIPDYQFVDGQGGFLKSPITGNTGNAYTRGIGVDSNGDLYLSGVKPGLGFPSNIPPDTGIFRLNSADGSAVYDTMPFNGAGTGSVVNSADKAVHSVGYWYSAPSPVIIQDRGYQTVGNSFTNYYTFGQYATSNVRLIKGVKTDGVGNYYYAIVNDNNSIGIVKANSSNVYVTSVSISRNPFSGLQIKDFAIDSNQNIYILTTFSAGIGVLAKFSYSGGTYSLAWRKQFNYEADGMAVTTSNIFLMFKTGAFTMSIVKLDINGNVVTQKGYDQIYSSGVEVCRLSIGSDGNLYSQTPFASWDTSLNLRWCNTVYYQPYTNTYTGPTGNAGVEEKDGSVYAASTIGYNTTRCIFAFKVPSDGTVIAPGLYWLGNGYMRMIANTLNEYNFTTVTSANSTYVVSATFGSNINTTTSFTSSIPQDNFTINVQI
jgi:hypothetical protein